MKLLTRILLSVLVMAACPVHGQSVFNKYGPVAGIQLSNGLTYQNTAATSSDVVDLFGTTANSFLATPNGSTGVLALRSIVGADLPPINLASTANGGVSSSSILLGTNGGTSNGFFSVVGPTTSLKTFTFPNASATVLTTNAAVTVPQGGTGLATLTAHGVMLGEGTSSPSFVTMGADTVLLGAASADPTAAALTNCGDSSHAVSYSTSSHAFGCQTLTTGGSVTNVASGTGLTGGPITTTGTLSVDQAFTPTWTGLHIFDAGGGTTPSVRIGTTGAQGILCVGNSSTCNSNPTSGDPAHTIELVDNGGALQGIRLLTYASGANAISPLHWARANGTQASPTAIVSNDNILSIGARGYTGSAMSGSAIAIEGIATENWSGTALGSKLQFEVVPNTGTTRVPVFAMIATSSASNPSMITNGTGGTSVGFMPVIDAAGTRYGYWGKASGSNNDISYESDAGLRLTANNGADPMHVGQVRDTPPSRLERSRLKGFKSTRLIHRGIGEAPDQRCHTKIGSDDDHAIGKRG